MARHRSEAGAALILLIGIIAALAIIAATTVMVLNNETGATAHTQVHKVSMDSAEAALDTSITIGRWKTIPTTSTGGQWLTQSEVWDALSTLFPAGTVMNWFKTYDNRNPVDTSVWWDGNADGKIWLEVSLTYQGKTTRMRVMLWQRTQNMVQTLPRAVVYSDTGIDLADSSDVYAVENDGTTAYNPANHSGAYATTIMVGGGWVNGNPAAAKNFVGNGSANLAKPGSSAQSLNVDANGTVTPSYAGTVAGGVGLLSDYFNQQQQSDLQAEAQTGMTAAAVTAPTAPTAPSAPTAPAPTPTPTPAATATADWANTSSTAAVDYSSGDYKVVGNLTLSRGTNTAIRTFKFRKLYVTGNLTLTGPVQLTCTDFLRVDGSLTVNNATATAVTDTFSGAFWVGNTASGSTTTTDSVAGPVTINAASSFYSGYNLALSNTGGTTAASLYSKGTLALSGNTSLSATSVYSSGATTISGATAAVTDQIGSLFVAGSAASSVTGTVTLNATSSIYSAGALTLGNSATTTPQIYAVGALTLQGTNTVSASGSIYSAGALTISNPTTTTGILYTVGAGIVTGNVTVKATALYAAGDFTIQSATTAVTDQFASVWCNGTCDWSGTTSVQTTNYLNASAAPGPMFIRILARSGTYNDTYGYVWLVGDAGTSDVACDFESTGNSTVMCPLLGTTEKTTTSGHVTFGTPTKPMVYYMVCDNDDLYSNTCEWGSTGTFYGLMLIMEAQIVISNGNGTTPNIVGAVFNGTPYYNCSNPYDSYDIALTDSSTIAYNQAVISAIIDTAITTMTTTTQTVPGTYQQL